MKYNLANNESLEIDRGSTTRKNILEVCQDNTLLVKGIGGYDGSNSQVDGVKTLQEVINSKQDKLAAGNNISIEDGEVSAIGYKFDTDLSSFAEISDIFKSHYIDYTSDVPAGSLTFTGAAGSTTYNVAGEMIEMMSGMVGTIAFKIGDGLIALLTSYDPESHTATFDKSLDENNDLSATPFSKIYMYTQITFSGDANATTYSFVDVLEVASEFTNGTKIKIGNYPIATIVSIDIENSIITLDKTLDPTNAVSDAMFDYALLPNNTASGYASHTEGEKCTASGVDSHAEGEGCTASGSSSHAEGEFTTASNYSSHAEGKNTHACEAYSHAEGEGSKTKSSFTVTGAANTTTYTTSINHGLKVGQVVMYNNVYKVITSIPSTTSFTVNNTLSSDSLNEVNIYIVTGVAYGLSSHTEGKGTTASGEAAHAEGMGNIASGRRSHAEGSDTTASGDYSHSEGMNTTASGDYSHAEGSYTTASNNNEHAEGKFNISIQNKTIHTVGIGESYERKNAHEIHKDGKHYVYGIGGYNGSNSQTAGVKTLQEVINNKQDKLTAGTGIEISQNNTITCNLDSVLSQIDQLNTTISQLNNRITVLENKVGALENPTLEEPTIE